MSKEARCIGCNIYLGEIHDARLHKDIKFLCVQCNMKRIASDLGKKGNCPPISDADTVDFLKGMFGMKEK